MFASRTLFMNTATVPGAPTSVTATPLTGTSAIVEFTAPVDNGGRVITKYTAVSSPGGITGVVNQAGSGTITVTGLSVNTSYTFTVYATNLVGNGASSDPTTSITTYNIPSAPATVTAATVSNTSATLSYTEPAGEPTRYSTNFPGSSGSYLYSPSSTTLALGSSDFTVEFWFNTTTVTSSYPILVCNGNFGANKWQINDRHGSWPTVLTVSIYNQNSVGGGIVGTTTISNNTWYHVALVRSGSSLKLYLNGVQEGSTLTFSGSMDGGTAQTIYIGQDQTQGAATCYNGKISNLRMVKGVSVYTGAFTVPGNTLQSTQYSSTNISAITGTQTALLTCQSSTTIDNSTNNFTMTLAGTASIASSAPIGNLPSIYAYTGVSSPGNISKTVRQAGSGTMTVTGLTPRTDYTFNVYATNVGGNSANTTSNSITTYGPPDAPTLGTISATSGTAITVNVVAPSYNGGSAITSYTVTCLETSTTKTLAQAGSGSVSFTGLTSGSTYTFNVYATNIYGNSATSATSSGVTTNSQYLVTTPGDYLFTPPDGVTSICVVCIGGGGGGFVDSFTASTFTGSGAGGGGGLGYKNNIAVVPGTGYPFTVGAGGVKNSVASSITSGGDSFFIDTATVKGGGGGRATGRPGGTGGTYVGTGGGNGGAGGAGQQFSYPTAGGGGGAGGYSGNGGNGQSNGPPSTASQAGSGGGGGGGGMAYYNNAPLNPTTLLLYGYCYGGLGGSTGPYGQGTNGTAGTQGQQSGGAGGYGSGSTNARGRGGGGGGDGQSGLVRIIFGSGRAFPSTNTADQ